MHLREEKMHRLVRERLEEHLQGGGERPLPREVEAHRAGCAACRQELNGFLEQGQLLRALRAPEEMAPAPGFYARVLERIEAGQGTSIWSALLEPVFGRLAIGSLAALVLLASFLVLTERDNAPPLEATAASIIAVEDHPPGLGQDPQRDRDTVLVTLATFQE